MSPESCALAARPFIAIAMISWRDPQRFTRFSRRICAEYLSLKTAGAVGGVRFLYGPALSLNDPNGVVLLGINPGGEVDLSDRLCSSHTGYYSELWTTSDYRTQVCDFMKTCFGLAGAADWKSAWDRCLTSNLIPFRSPSLAELENRPRSREFSRALWRDIFAEIEPKTIIAFGKPPGDAVYAILKGGEQICDLCAPIRLGPPLPCGPSMARAAKAAHY